MNIWKNGLSHVPLCIEWFLCVHTEVNVLSGIAINWYMIHLHFEFEGIFVSTYVHCWIPSTNSLVWRHNWLLCVIEKKNIGHFIHRFVYCLIIDFPLHYIKSAFEWLEKMMLRKIVELRVGVQLQESWCSPNGGSFSEWRNWCLRGRKGSTDNKLRSRSKFELLIRKKMRFRFTHIIFQLIMFNMKINLMMSCEQRIWTIQCFVLVKEQ